MEIQQHKGGMSLDTHEQIVEVVGDTPGQRTDGFHLLGLKKLRFQSLLVGNIHHDALIMMNVIFLILYSIGIDQDPDHATILTVKLGLKIPHFTMLRQQSLDRQATGGINVYLSTNVRNGMDQFHR